MLLYIRKAILLVVAAFFIVYFIACRKDPVQPASAENPLFSLILPEGYVHVNNTSGELYSGFYYGPSGSFNYWAGEKAFSSVNAFQPADFSYYEEFLIQGAPARLMVQTIEDRQDLYLIADKDGKWKKVKLHASHLSKQESFALMKIFKSLQFK